MDYGLDLFLKRLRNVKLLLHNFPYIHSIPRKAGALPKILDLSPKLSPNRKYLQYNSEVLFLDPGLNAVLLDLVRKV